MAAAAAGLDEPTALGLLDELVGADLVRETDTPRRMRFRHPIIRHAVYESVGPGWRLGAHRRAADALAEVGAPPLARAHHVAAAGRPGDEGAVRVLAEAGHKEPKADAPASMTITRVGRRQLDLPNLASACIPIVDAFKQRFELEGA